MISLVAMGTEWDEDVSWFTGCLNSACAYMCMCVRVSMHVCVFVWMHVHVRCAWCMHACMWGSVYFMTFEFVSV